MLNGDRVRLRAVEKTDVPRLWELFDDLELESIASPRPPEPESLAQAEARYDKLIEEDNPRWVRFAIEVDGDVIGECSLHGIDRHNRTCDVGIVLGRDYWGKGYGQDAVRTLVAYAFMHENMHRVGLEALADDPRAIGAYKKAGFVEEGRLRKRDWVNGSYQDVMLMGILREEWTPPQG